VGVTAGRFPPQRRGSAGRRSVPSLRNAPGSESSIRIPWSIHLRTQTVVLARSAKTDTSRRLPCSPQSQTPAPAVCEPVLLFSILNCFLFNPVIFLKTDRVLDLFANFRENRLVHARAAGLFES
jgi:hypothetical protein